MKHALANEPHPMSAEETGKLTWEAATERFLDVTQLTEKDLRPGPVAGAVENLLWVTHNTLSGMESARAVVGAGSNTRDNPQRLTDYQPDDSDLGGLFDDKNRARKAHSKCAAAAAATAAQKA